MATALVRPALPVAVRVPPELDVLETELDADVLADTLELDAPIAPHLWSSALVGPARDFLVRPGKRFRARLVAAAWQLAGGAGEPPAPLPSIVEILHAGSLIVDDIEDGALERRGAPSLHRVVGTPTALNVGNWMYVWPSLLVARAGLPAPVELAIHRDIARCLVRSHQGQALDLALRVPALPQADVPGVVAAIGRLKAGALLELAARLGARAAGAAEEVVVALGRLGRTIGEVLQRLDDLGTVTSRERVFKAIEDLGQGRCTWPWALLAEGDAGRWRERVAALTEVIEAPTPRAVHELAATLAWDVGEVGRARVRAELDAALASLRARFSGPAVDVVADSIRDLEVSYG